MDKKQIVYHEVWNEEELLKKMKKREFYILIKGDFNEKVKLLLGTSLSDDDLMGIELGSHGTIGIFSEIIYQILNTRSGKSKMDRTLESKIRQYNFKIDKGNTLLKTTGLLNNN